jgi:hypothetical protein
MKSFLAKNWLFIVVPLIAMAIAIAVILSLGGSDSGAEFQYGM